MKVLILGVGDAFTYRSFGTSAVVQGKEGPVLLDCPDLIHRALFEGSLKSNWDVDVGAIDDVIITHLHGDHCNGLESFGFAKLVNRLMGKSKSMPRLWTHPAAAARVWERLAPAMDAPLTKGGRKSELRDYFDLRIIEPNMTSMIQGLAVECRYTIHSIPTIGLKLTDGKGSLGWSGDTVYEQAHIEWLSDCNVIVHEANLGPVHTNIETLNSLPEDVRRKMRVTHIVDNFDPDCTDMKALEQGELIEI